MTIAFTHHQAAHCETGVTANLLRHVGLPISEALAFGIGSGIHFAHFAFIKINHLPLTAFRSAPGSILKKATRRLGIEIASKKYFRQSAAMQDLERKLEDGLPVGLQTGVFWLPYFPSALRFHFNAHNLVVYGREDGGYLISDPVMEGPVFCPREDLQKARFAKGMFGPRGRMFVIVRTPKCIDLQRATLLGLKESCRNMLELAFPLVGVKGIRFLAKQVERWPRALGEDQSRLCLAQIVRMQEEIGTGGAGFRFMFAAFLQEAAGILSEDHFLDLSSSMTSTGDHWRRFAVACARIIKGRACEGETYPLLAEMLRDCADREEGLFQELRAVLKAREAAC